MNSWFWRFNAFGRSCGVRVVSKAKNLFVITGAGISAESGISTFRGADGFWRKYSVTDLATREAFHYDPSLVLEFYHYRRELVSKKSSNAGHYAIRDLEKLFATTGRSFTLATQNVDGFHFLAGNKNVIEPHGSLFKVRCLECGIVVENRVNPICPALAGRGFYFEGKAGTVLPQLLANLTLS